MRGYNIIYQRSIATCRYKPFFTLINIGGIDDYDKLFYYDGYLNHLSLNYYTKNVEYYHNIHYYMHGKYLNNNFFIMSNHYKKKCNIKISNMSSLERKKNTNRILKN